MSQGVQQGVSKETQQIKETETMVAKELDHVYICADGKKFLLKEEAEKYEQKLKDSDNDYKIFNN